MNQKQVHAPLGILTVRVNFTARFISLDSKPWHAERSWDSRACLRAICDGHGLLSRAHFRGFHSRQEGHRIDDTTAGA